MRRLQRNKRGVRIASGLKPHGFNADSSIGAKLSRDRVSKSNSIEVAFIDFSLKVHLKPPRYPIVFTTNQQPIKPQIFSTSDFGGPAKVYHTKSHWTSIRSNRLSIMESTGLDNEFLSTRYGALRVAHFVSIDRFRHIYRLIYVFDGQRI